MFSRAGSASAPSGSSAAAPELTALDQAIGDGDHGTNMNRGFGAIVAQLDAGSPEADSDRALTGTVLKTAGRTLISTVGGAAGPLYGTAFMRAGTALSAADADQSPADIVLTVLEAAIGGDRVARQGDGGREDDARRAHARRSSAGRAARETTDDVGEVLRAMADAAEAGATATIPLLATKGRASYLGERSIGHQDPGATSSALLLRTLADVAAAAAG